jgi:hypothetical protein
MTLFYRVGDEIVIEMSPKAWKRVEGAIWDNMIAYNGNGPGLDPVLDRELTCFANAIRAHLQHVAQPVPPAADNMDLV